MGRLALLYRLIIRPVYRQPGRALIILFAVALGDAAVVAIDLAGDAAAGSFHSSMETLTGKDGFEITAAGGLSESIVAKVARLPYPLSISPRIEDHALLLPTGETVPLIGVDIIAETSNSGTTLGAIAQAATAVQELRYINDPDAVWVTRGLGKAVGDRIQLLINDRMHAYTVRGLIPESAPGSGSDATSLGTEAILMDIGAAQLATGKSGRVDRILIKTPSTADLEAWHSKLQQALPAGVLLNAQGTETAANQRMLAAFRWNLPMLSGIALLVGAFLIYNAVSISVVRRRVDIGIVRALGASRGMVTSAFLLEAALLGTVGSLAALPLGRLLASGAVVMLSTTLNAHYAFRRPGAISISLASVALGLIVGIGVALASALPPARDAGIVPPTAAMARGSRESEVRAH